MWLWFIVAIPLLGVLGYILSPTFDITYGWYKYRQTPEGKKVYEEGWGKGLTYWNVIKGTLTPGFFRYRLSKIAIRNRHKGIKQLDPGDKVHLDPFLTIEDGSSKIQLSQLLSSSRPIVLNFGSYT